MCKEELNIMLVKLVKVRWFDEYFSPKIFFSSQEEFSYFKLVLKSPQIKAKALIPLLALLRLNLK